jgi:hypothetical protein
MPESSSNRGELIAPALRITSEPASTVCCFPPRLYVTPVARPASRGFGTALLGQALAHQHSGRVELDWRRSGLVCRMSLPLG